MTLKRLTALLLCLAFAAPLAGCNKTLPADGTDSTAASSSASGPLTPEEGAHITFRTSGSTDIDWGKDMAQQFEAQYGVPVEVQEGGLSDTLNITTELPSGQGPDVLLCAHDKVPEVMGVVMPLDDSIIQNVSQNVVESAMKTVTFDGKVYGVPVSMDTYAMFYNKAVVTGQPATSYEELAQQAKTFNDPNNNKFLFLFDASTGSPLYCLLSAYGYNVFGDDGTDENNPGFDTPAFEKGLEVLKAYHDNVIPAISTDLGITDSLNTNFENGNTGYILSGPWDVKTFRDAGVDLGVTNLPTYDGHQQRSFTFVQDALVSDYTSYPNASQLFAQFLVSSESAESLYSKAGRITTRKDISSVKGLGDDEVMSAIVKSFANTIAAPSAKRMNFYWRISNDIFTAVFDGKLSPEEGVQQAQERWQSLLQSESSS